MKKLTKFFFILIVIFSLSLNVLLLYDKTTGESNSTSENEVDIKDTTKKEKEKTILLNKSQIMKMFKDYLIESNYIDADNLAVFESTKITNVGYFKSNENKKLYYIDLKFSCLQGSDCVRTMAQIKTGEDYTSTTTLVVAITPVDESTAIFEILDYSIEQNTDFEKINAKEIK